MLTISGDYLQSLTGRGRMTAKFSFCTLPVMLLAGLLGSSAWAAPAKKPPAHTATTAKKPPAGNAAAASAAVGGDQPVLLGQYGDWGAYTAAPSGKKVCFALSKPRGAQSAGQAAYLFISTRPAENVRNEVSVIIGYPFNSTSEATVDLGGTTFAMYTQNAGAWIKNVADENSLVDSMKKGTQLTVSGTSEKGANSTDTFSLAGITQALNKVAQECK
jgi:hypothetical protein